MITDLTHLKHTVIVSFHLGSFDMIESPVDLGAICNHACSLVGPRLRRNVMLKMDCPTPGSTFVYSEPALLLQLLTNLIANAAKFVENGSVTVVCHCSAENVSSKGRLRVVLGVADTGPGIDTTRSAVMIRQFGSRDPSHVEADAIIEGETAALPSFSTGSTGMGLHLANTIVQIIGKFVCANTRNESNAIPSNELALQIQSPLSAEMTGVLTDGGGPGSFIFMDIEMKEAPATSLWRAALLGDEGGAEQFKTFCFKPSGVLRLLIVDDQRTMRNMVLMLFQKICFEFPSMRVLASTAISGEEAVRLCKSNSFHIITLDETYSYEYCIRMIDQQREVAEVLGLAASAAAAESGQGKLHRLLLDSDRDLSQQRRTEFFADEALKHNVLETDGFLSGHETLKKILEGHDGRLGSPPFIFNIKENAGLFE
jgi:CheY-like chemotaxis protein